MGKRATGHIKVKDWDEKPYDEIEGEKKLTRARYVQSYNGDIEGEGVVDMLMVYPDEASANYVGLERVIGRIGNRSGSFVLQCNGKYENGEAKTTSFVVPGSGTGELTGLRGEGSYNASGGEMNVTFTLDYDFD